MFKLVEKRSNKFYVVCQYDSESTVLSPKTYIFPNIEELEKFVGIKDDAHHVSEATDIYGERHVRDYYESILEIYSKQEYKVVYEEDK